MMYVVQYIIVRKDLAKKLNRGMLAAQVAHASLAPITRRIQARNLDFDPEFLAWIDVSFAKIILEAPTPKLYGIMSQLFSDEIEYHPIYESTLDNTLTCIGLKPYDKERVAPYFKDLQLLK